MLAQLFHAHVDLHVKGLPAWMTKMNPDKMSVKDRSNVVRAPPHCPAKIPRLTKSHAMPPQPAKSALAARCAACSPVVDVWNELPALSGPVARRCITRPLLATILKTPCCPPKPPHSHFSPTDTPQLKMTNGKYAAARKACLETEKNGARCIF